MLKVALLLILATAASAGVTSADTAYGAVTVYFKVKHGTDAPGAFAKVAATFPFATVAGFDTKLTDTTPLPAVLGGVLNLGDAPKPAKDSLDEIGRDLAPADVALLDAADRAFALQFVAKPDDAVKTLKMADQLVLALAKELDGVVWDSDLYLLISRSGWEKSVAGGWKDGVPSVHDHINIHVRANGDLLRAVTRGMTKFGLPDLVVDAFPKSALDAVGALINHAAQELVEGRQPVADGAFLVIDGARRTKVWLEPATKQDNDPDNRLVAIAFHGAGTPQENLMRALGEGVKDDVALVDPGAPAAAARAKARLPEIAARFRAGLPLGERILVKAPFPTPEGNREWMWLEVTRWDGDAIDGILQNKPVAIPTLKEGARVSAKQPEVASWAHYRKDGTRESDGPDVR